VRRSYNSAFFCVGLPPIKKEGADSQKRVIESNILSSLIWNLFSILKPKIKAYLFYYMINKLKSFIFARVSILIKELLVAVWSMPSLGLALLSLLVGLYLEHYTAFIGGQLIVFFSIL
jgi:hypothetical protein